MLDWRRVVKQQLHLSQEARHHEKRHRCAMKSASADFRGLTAMKSPAGAADGRGHRDSREFRKPMTTIRWGRLRRAWQDRRMPGPLLPRFAGFRRNGGAA